MASSPEERRHRRDRRRAQRAARPEGERRQGVRRRADLPRRRWPEVLAFAALGVGSAIAGQAAIARQGRAALTVATHASPEPRREATEVSPEVARWRDAAASLTPAEVDLDERARDRWLPRLERIERGRLDPTLPLADRRAYAEIAADLQRVGVTSAPANVQIAP